MPVHPPHRRTILRDAIRSGDADGILATAVVATGLIVCALTWHPPLDAQPPGVAQRETAQARPRSALVSLTDGPDRVAVALPEE